jgi:hypothetical protein
MQPRELHALLDILIASRLALSYVSGKTQTEFLDKVMLDPDEIQRPLQSENAIDNRIDRS